MTEWPWLAYSATNHVGGSEPGLPCGRRLDSSGAGPMLRPETTVRLSRSRSKMSRSIDESEAR